MRNSIHRITVVNCHGDYMCTPLRDFIDWTSGIFACGLGGWHKNVCEAIEEQLHKCMHSYQFETPIRKQYLKALTEYTGFESAYMFSSGTEATEAAWKIARMVTGKTGIVGLDHAFHGKTLGALIMAGHGFKGIQQWGQWDPANTGALIFEPYVAKTAAFHSPETIARIQRLVEENNLILIADEIQSGFGRTGKFFGYQHYPDLVPDIVCIGKQMANGFPASAILGPAEWLENDIYQLSSTNGGNPLACAAGMAVLSQFHYGNLDDHINKASTLFWRGLNELDRPVNGRGLVASIWFDSVVDADQAVMDLTKAGLLVVHTKSQTIKLAPHLNCDLDVLQRGLDILKEVLN